MSTPKDTKPPRMNRAKSGFEWPDGWELNQLTTEDAVRQACEVLRLDRFYQGEYLYKIKKEGMLLFGLEEPRKSGEPFFHALVMLSPNDVVLDIDGNRGLKPGKDIAVRLRDFVDTYKLKMRQNALGKFYRTKFKGRVYEAENFMKEYLAEIDRSGKKPAILDFSTVQGHKIDAHNFKALAEWLKTNDSVEILILSKNKAQNEGAAHMADALKVNKTVRIVDFSGNEICSHGFSSLATMLRSNSTLVKCILDQNKPGYQGSWDLWGAMHANKNLLDVGCKARGDTREFCRKNLQKADDLLAAAQNNPLLLKQADLQEIQDRASAIMYIAGEQKLNAQVQAQIRSLYAAPDEGIIENPGKDGLNKPGLGL